MDRDARVDRRIGKMLRDKWKLERVLGVGGMAAVYEARHRIGRRDAIKILHADIAKIPNARARFEQEAHAANRFVHPGAVEIRDYDIAEDGSPFLVMELLDGELLSDRLKRLGSIELPELLRFMDELCDVLAAAHAQGIIHRDIKLDNLFVEKNGGLKVLDFGLARMLDGIPGRARTMPGAMLGTVAYRAPEQARGKPIDERADIFSVGATMFRLLAKRRIHESEMEADVRVKMAMEPAPPLASVAPGTPPDVCLVVDRAVMFDREQRYPNALTMQADVRALLRGAPPPYATALKEGRPPPIIAAPVVSPPSVPAIDDPPTQQSAVQTLSTKAQAALGGKTWALNAAAIGIVVLLLAILVVLVLVLTRAPGH